MDKKRGLANVIISIGFKVAILVVMIFVRRLVIRYLGNEINGLNSLYVSILDFLAIAELGVGSAISYCMYKPIVDGDKDKVAALYHLFTKLYLIIGGVILVFGCAIMPFLQYLAKDYREADVDLYSTFAVMLVSVVITYFFSAKTSLIEAHKNNYITTMVASGGRLLQDGLQVLVLVSTRSFLFFLLCRILSAVLQWLVTEIIARQKYGDIIYNKSRTDAETRKQVARNVRAMFMHKIGGTLVNASDSIIISAFIGVVVLGKYSNYTMIMLGMTSVLSLCFSSLVSVIGHMYVEAGPETARRYSNFFHTFNFVLGMVFFLGYYAVIDDLIVILFGANLELSRTIAMVITADYFIQFMLQSIAMFRDATGTFYNDRWRPAIEGVVNVGLSILFVIVFPEEYKVVGVIVATILTNLLICHVIMPHVVYKNAFKASAKGFYVRNYLYFVLFAGALFALHFCMMEIADPWLELLVNGCIAVAIALVPGLIAMLANRDFRYYFKRIFEKVRHHRHKDRESG